MYNIILLPWLIKNIFEIKERRLVYLVVSICFLFFFYYKVKVGMGMDYISDILKYIGNLPISIPPEKDDIKYNNPEANDIFIHVSISFDFLFIILVIY